MSKTKISSTLNRKRKIAFVKKIGAIIIFIIFFISLFILFLTLDKIKIKNVGVIGNSTVYTEEILNLVQKQLDEKYLWIIPTDNIFLLQRFEIKKEILENIKKIKSVEISMDGFNTLGITISERVSESFWCSGQPDDSKKCYFMDDSGLIFAEAPDFTNNIFMKYYGLILKDNPIGENYFSPDRFKKIKDFLFEIKKIGFNSEDYFAIDEHQYEIVLSGGAKIMLDDKEDFSKNILKLNTLIKNGYIKTDLESISKIKHIDLRYGNKVHYDFK